MNLERQEHIDTTLKNIAFILKEYRRIFQITQKKLASKVSLPSGHISKFENQKLCPSIALWSYICKKLEIPLELIFFNNSDIYFFLQTKKDNH